MSQSQTLLDMGFLPSQVCEVQAEEWLPCHQYVSVQRIFMNLRWISPRSPCGSSLRNTEMTGAQPCIVTTPNMLVVLRSPSNVETTNKNSWISLGSSLAPCLASRHGSGRHSGIRNPIKFQCDICKVCEPHLQEYILRVLSRPLSLKIPQICV
jgi:hypothetical protein